MITKVSDTYCWTFPVGDEGDEIHFLTEQTAAEFAGKYAADHVNAPGIERVRQLPVPCWTATCDGKGDEGAVCDSCECTEDGDAAHIPALNARHALADLQELTRVGRDLLCDECRHLLFPPPDPAQLPAIVTYDDIARLIAVTSVLLDRVRLDAKSQAFVDSLVTTVTRLPVGRYAWEMSVRPFVVQLPLPDMPTPDQSIQVGTVFTR